LLVVTPVFLSGAIAADALSQESRSRTLLTNRPMPISTRTLVLGKLVIPVVLGPVQVTVWLGLFALNGFPSHDPWTVVAFATVMGIFITGTGGIIAALVRNESTTQAAYVVFVLGIGVFSLMLPRDPMNVIALLTAGVTDGAAWTSVGLLSLAAAVGLVASIWVTRRRIQRDML
jgi:ABC-type Na+ efflux pump permease subunit